MSGITFYPSNAIVTLPKGKKVFHHCHHDHLELIKAISKIGSLGPFNPIPSYRIAIGDIIIEGSRPSFHSQDKDRRYYNKKTISVYIPTEDQVIF